MIGRIYYTIDRANNKTITSTSYAAQVTFTSSGSEVTSPGTDLVGKGSQVLTRTDVDASGSVLYVDGTVTMSVYTLPIQNSKTNVRALVSIQQASLNFQPIMHGTALCHTSQVELHHVSQQKVQAFIGRQRLTQSLDHQLHTREHRISTEPHLLSHLYQKSQISQPGLSSTLTNKTRRGGLTVSTGEMILRFQTTLFPSFREVFSTAYTMNA